MSAYQVGFRPCSTKIILHVLSHVNSITSFQSYCSGQNNVKIFLTFSNHTVYTLCPYQQWFGMNLSTNDTLMCHSHHLICHNINSQIYPGICIAMRSDITNFIGPYHIVYCYLESQICQQSILKCHLKTLILLGTNLSIVDSKISF